MINLSSLTENINDRFVRVARRAIRFIKRTTGGKLKRATGNAKCRVI